MTDQQAPDEQSTRVSRYARWMGGRRLLVDLGPLRRHRDFRLLTIGQFFSSFGSQFVVIALPLQIFETTHHSTLQVGLIGLVQLGPMLGGSMLGGVIADTYDRRRILIVTRFLLTVIYAGLYLDALSHSGAVWPLYLIAAASAGVLGVSSPASIALVPSIVGVEDIAPASAISQVIMNITTIAGPSLGGLLIAEAGFTPVYLVVVITTGMSIATLIALTPLGRAEGAPKMSLAAFTEGFRYLRSDKVLSGAFLVDFQAMVFGMPLAVFPALAIIYYHGGARTYGLLSSAPAAGALLSSLVSGWLHNIRRHGLGIIVCVLIWGVTITILGVVKVLWVGILMLAIAGAADMVSVVFRITILQTTVPDYIRGRMGAALGALAISGNNLGNTEAGFAATIGGPQFAVWSGGLACIVGALLFAWRVPELLAYDKTVTTSQSAGDDSPLSA